MFYKLFSNETGDFINQNNQSVNLIWAESVMTSDNTSDGWIEFDNLELAMKYFNIYKYNNLQEENTTYEQMKIYKLDELEKKFRDKLSQGYYDSDFKVTLAILPEDRKSFTEILTMLNLADSLGEPVGNITIADINGQLHEFPYIHLKILLLKYGFYYQTIWQIYSTLKNTINSCDENQLNNIEITL